MEHIDYWEQVKAMSVEPGKIHYELINSLHYFDFLWAEEISLIALKALEFGDDHPALTEIQGINYPIYSEYAEPLEKWLGHNGQGPLTKREAGLNLAGFVCRDIVTGEIPPLDGGKIIWKDIYYDAEAPVELFPFVSRTSAYEDCLVMLNEERREYLDEIAVAAREFIHR